MPKNIVDKSQPYNAEKDKFFFNLCYMCKHYNQLYVKSGEEYVEICGGYCYKKDRYVCLTSYRKYNEIYVDWLQTDSESEE